MFVDGDFWHGNNWRIRGLSSLEAELKRYSPYWQEKIKRNCERDLENTIRLRDEGWTVLRFWESDIKNDVEVCVKKIIEAIAVKR